MTLLDLDLISRPNKMNFERDLALKSTELDELTVDGMNCFSFQIYF